MALSSVSGIRSIVNSIRQAGLNACGGRKKTFVINDPKTIERIKWIGREISSPENRLILGVTALMSQPFIDAHNPTLDDEVKGVVIARTIAKILVGTTTGVIIRKGCIKAIDYMTTMPEQIKEGMKHVKLRQLLLPVAEKLDPQKLSQYKNTMGTLLALGVMVFTNFLIDAPLTQVLTNIMVKAKYNKKNGGENAKSK